MPTTHLHAPKQGRHLPDIISETQIDALLAAPDTESSHGLRDKALLELIYASGLRVTEAQEEEGLDTHLHGEALEAH